VFLVKKEQGERPRTMKVLNAVSAKAHDRGLQQDVLDISENKEDPADVATAFLKKNGLDDHDVTPADWTTCSGGRRSR